MNSIKQLNYVKGNSGENRAAVFLINKGFEIICNNYRSKHGEIDIIAAKNTKVNGKTEIVYHFVEVKLRTGSGFGMGREAVTLQKQKRIRNAAKSYLIENKRYDEVYSCFDVIELTGPLDNPSIEHLENCF